MLLELLRRKGKTASLSASGSKPSNGSRNGHLGPSEPQTPGQTPDGPASASPVDAGASGEGPAVTYDSEAEDDAGSNAESDDDAMSIDGKSDVTVETPPRPPI